jgi:hypothetical protein
MGQGSYIRSMIGARCSPWITSSNPSRRHLGWIERAAIEGQPGHPEKSKAAPTWRSEKSQVGLDAEARMYLLDLWRRRAATDQWVEAFCDLVLAFKPIGLSGRAGADRLQRCRCDCDGRLTPPIAERETCYRSPRRSAEESWCSAVFGRFQVGRSRTGWSPYAWPVRLGKGLLAAEP